jgi:hypothetical protein
VNEPHGLRACARKELLADFEHPDFGRQQLHQVFNMIEMVDIESENQPLSHRQAGTNQLEVGCHASMPEAIG